MPSPRIQRREPPHNPRVSIGDGFVHISDVVISIRYAIVVGITGVNRVRICCAVRDGLFEPLVVDMLYDSDKDGLRNAPAKLKKTDAAPIIPPLVNTE